MSVINTNMSALIGQKNLGSSQSALQIAMERLSSGLRINSAKDDAAGQAIANRMTAQITGLAQAQRNANDGISLAQTAEGSLAQVTDNLQRIRELTVQAENDTNSADDLQSIQDEIGQRLEEIDRISRETSFNGVSVLAETRDLTIQVGANDGQTITVSLEQINRETLFGGESFNVNGHGTLSGAYADGQLQDGVGNDILAGDVTITDAGSTLSNLELQQDDRGNWFVTGDDADGNQVAIAVSDSDFAITDGDPADLVTTPAELEISINSDTAALVEARTDSPLAALDAALNNVDALRSQLGAIQNRFEDAVTNLGTNETNLAAARSRIQDADYAVEVSEMTRAQILQQAGTSVLAQANQVPQTVLSLLG